MKNKISKPDLDKVHKSHWNRKKFPRLNGEKYSFFSVLCQALVLDFSLRSKEETS